MSIKKVMMAFSRLSEKGEIEDITVEQILENDVTGHLARIHEEKLMPLLSIGATKSGWGYTPRTRSFSKY